MSTNRRSPFSARRPAPRLMAGALAASMLLPAPALAFYQTTTLEGAVGADLGGVWLSMQQIMPEFRITYPKPASGPAVPIEVGAIPADLEPVVGKNPKGVAVKSCGTSNFCADFGLVAGDILIKMNAHEITDVASFEKAQEDVPQTVLLSVRRPALQMTTARLLKMRYSTEAKEVGGTTEQAEELDIQILDVKLPFAERMEKVRVAGGKFALTSEELEQMKTGWSELDLASPMVWMKGQHRFVAKASFDEALATDAALAASRYALVMDLAGNPTKGGGQAIDIYGMESVSDSTISGEYVTVTVAAAPFPINIEFKGRFVMTKLSPWSDADEKKRAKERAAEAPKEDLSKFQLMPEVPESAKKPAAPAN